MFGTILNNRSVNDLIDRGIIKLSGFDGKKLKTIHYPLFPAQIVQRGEKSERKPKFKVVHDFMETNDPFVFEANQYAIVKTRESICVPKGIVGHFVPSSNLIDLGFALVAGRVESPWGEKGEQLRFGLKNLLATENSLAADEQIAHVYFVDLRGLANIEFPMSAKEKEMYKRWRKNYAQADDDGVKYDTDGED